MSSLRDERVADVLRRVTDVEHKMARRHPGFADAVRAPLARLRGGLEHAHARSDKVAEPRWAEYVADLDHGLDELTLEIDRAADQQVSGADVTDAVAAHVSALEQSGWRLHFATVDGPHGADPTKPEERG